MIPKLERQLDTATPAVRRATRFLERTVNLTVSDWLQAADHEVEMRHWRAESQGKLKNLTVESRFPGLSPDVVRWYYTNFDEESYRLWHPSHIGLQWD